MPNMFGRDDFIGSGVGQTPMSDADRYYDPDGVTNADVEQEEEDWDNGEY